MYLLNLTYVSNTFKSVLQFTFHYVSIKSNLVSVILLRLRQFTFHYVSIKSQTLDNPVRGRYDLHSTMYLLNLTH